jgi:hypothetical protein
MGFCSLDDELVVPADDVSDGVPLELLELLELPQPATTSARAATASVAPRLKRVANKVLLLQGLRTAAAGGRTRARPPAPRAQTSRHA